MQRKNAKHHVHEVLVSQKPHCTMKIIHTFRWGTTPDFPICTPEGAGLGPNQVQLKDQLCSKDASSTCRGGSWRSVEVVDIKPKRIGKC